MTTGTVHRVQDGVGGAPADLPILNNLVEHMRSATDQPLWRPGLGLDMRSLGGLVSRDKRHYTVVGHGEYANHVGGSRTLAANSQGIRTTKELRTSIGGDLAPDTGASRGRDSLTVDGDAEITFGARLVMMSGIVNRQWNGGVMRLASMEGVICGGGFLRLIASPSATLSGLNTGDVYGGCARVSAVRSYLAVLQYRAAQTALWAVGSYNRTATFVVEPVIGSPSDNPATNAASKLARLGRTLGKVRMICPPLDILIGVATLVPVGVYSIYKLISSAIKKPIAPPPSGPPRIRTQNTGVHAQAYQSVVST